MGRTPLDETKVSTTPLHLDPTRRRIYVEEQTKLYRFWEKEARRKGQHAAAERLAFRRRHIVETEVL